MSLKIEKDVDVDVGVVNITPVFSNYENDTIEVFGKKYKPIVSTTSIEKKISGESTGPVGESKIEHVGLYCKNSGFSITCEGSKTVNLGNYESAKIGVGITMPIDPDNLDAAYEWATDFISKKINEACEQVKK